jgi:hypothetical protein
VSVFDLAPGEVPRFDQSHPTVETRGGDRATHRYTGYRGFELTKDFVIRKVPVEKSNRHIGVRRFANPEDKAPGAFEIVKS